jgi:hypothetical protein
MSDSTPLPFSSSTRSPPELLSSLCLVEEGVLSSNQRVETHQVEDDDEGGKELVDSGKPLTSRVGNKLSTLETLPTATTNYSFKGIPRIRCGECEACLRDDCGQCNRCRRKVGNFWSFPLLLLL